MRKLLSAVLLLCASVCAFGQGATIPFQPAVTQQGNFLSFATITFCSIPTTVNTLGVCQTPVTVFKDQALTLPYSSAIQTDGIGYFPPNSNTATSIWFTPGTYCYTLTVSSMTSPATNPCVPFTISFTANSGSLTVPGNITQTQTTAATNVANQSSFLDCMNASYWTGVISATDQWCLQDVLGTGANPTSTFTLTHGGSPGSSGAATFSIPGNVSVGGTLGAASVNSVIDLVGKGCKGDGATDDKACIATVLAAAGALTTPLTVCITDNHTFLIGTNPGGAQVFTLPSNVSLGCKGTIKIGNSFGIYHALFRTSAGASFTTYEDFTVDGNATNNAVNSDPVGTNERVAIEVIGGSSQSVTWHNIKFINGNDVQTIVGNPCNDCTITENKWSNYGIGGTFDHDSSEIYLTGTNGTVALNQFDAAGIGVRTAIEVHQDNKTVIGNIMHNYRYGIITSANQSVAHNFSITGNTCNAVYRCVYIWAVDGSTDGLIVSGNQITINRNGFWTPTNDEAAIGTNLTNTFDLLNTKITGNNIHWVADTLPTSNTSAGISLTDTVGSFNLNKVEISGNKIDGTLCAGILAETLGLSWSGLAIKNNEITNPGQTNNSTTNCNAPAFRNGISLVGAGAGFTVKSSVIEGNHIADTQVTPTMQVGVRWIGVAGDGASGSGTGQPGLVSRNNTVSYVGTPALTTPYVLFSTTSPEYHENVPNFTRANPIDSGEAVSDFPPKGSSIYDPISGRLFIQSVLPSTGRALQSFETSQNIPSSGAYSVGDIVWKNGSLTPNGTCGWDNVVAGSPGSFTSIPCNLTGSKVFVTTDFTTANNTNLQAITGLSWTFPAVAANYSFHCSLLYSQATAAVADQFGIQAVTNNPTNIAASALAYSSSSASTLGTVPTLATTTATPLVTFTPSATATVFNATLEGTLELAASANTVNIMVQTSAGADAVTVKRGSYCQLF